MTQTSLNFDATVGEIVRESARRSQERVQDTSREAYEGLKPSLGQREATVLRGLSRYVELNGEHPTSYELTRFLISRGEAYDLNSVRPRLTALKDNEHGLAETRGKRKCAVTKKNALVWAVTARGEAYLRGEK